MVAYERFAAFYDMVMDDPGPRAARVNAAIDHYHPVATSLLELGCGTGSILARLDTGAQLTGLDRSPAMLAVAAGKVPGAQLVEGDMAAFDLGRRFDVVVCVFDSVNHVLDVNTVGELHRLGEELPWVYDFEGGTAIIDVSFALDPEGLGVTDWDIRIFEQISGTGYQLHHECIGELALPLERVRALLAEGFDLLEEVDEDGLPATDASVKAYYALRRKD